MQVNNAHGKVIRRRCRGCYRRFRANLQRREAHIKCKQICTKCNVCDKFYCMKCFNEDHENE